MLSKAFFSKASAFRLASIRAFNPCKSLSSSAASFPAAFDSVFGSKSPEVAFLGTGPMALSMAANMLKTASTNGVQTPKVVLLTEQNSYYNALKSNGFKVVDERDMSVINVTPDQLIVVKSVDEYRSVSDSHPQVIFGTMQMGQKVERWGLVDVAKERSNGSKVTVLTAANGIPFTTMLDKVGDNGDVNTGHATLYAKGRVAIEQGEITVTTTDHGKISVGAVGSSLTSGGDHFAHMKTVMEGSVYSVELSEVCER